VGGRAGGGGGGGRLHRELEEAGAAGHVERLVGRRGEEVRGVARLAGGD